MRHGILFAATMILGGATAAPALAQDELTYVAVEPCRIVNTRVSAMGVIRANTFQNFRVVGSAEELASQGARSACPNPKADSGLQPVAVSAYIVAVPADSSTRAGILTAYPSDQPPPPAGSAATVNFAKDQVIGNTTNATLCNANEKMCPDDGSLAILARDTDEHVVIDVQGYFFPATSLPGYQIVQNNFATANSSSVVGQVFCPEGKRAMSGGGTATDATWYMDSSLPLDGGAGWQVRFRSRNITFSTAGTALAICVNADD